MLHGKVALITGGSRGIGRATAELFAREGALVYAGARRIDDLGGLAAESDSWSGRVIPLCLDVTDAAASKDAVLRIKKEQGRLDCLVNNAGIMENAVLGMIDEASMRRVFEVNVFAAIRLTQLASRVMARHGGSIVNLASVVGVVGHGGQAVYAASKGAVIALTRSAAKELAPKQIRVNAVAPGMIETDLLRKLPAETIGKRLGQIGMGRLGTPEDVAKVCLFLASDLSVYVTGQVVGIDGSAVL